MICNNYAKKIILVIVLIVICFSASGCALLNIPLRLLSTVINIVNKLPKPPPGVF